MVEELTIHTPSTPFFERGSLIPDAYVPVGQTDRSTGRLVVSWPTIGRVAVVTMVLCLLVVMSVSFINQTQSVQVAAVAQSISEIPVEPYQSPTAQQVASADTVLGSFIYEQYVAGVTADKYLVADLDTGAVLAGNNVLQQASIASLTKLMTAVVVADTLKLDEQIPVTGRMPVSSLVPRLTPGQTLSVYTLLQLLLIESSNEAGEVLARHTDRAAFIAQMNQTAHSVGMSQTKFTDPSGLDAGNVSSTQDLLRLLQHITETYPFIFDITATGAVEELLGMQAYDDLQNYNVVAEVDSFVGGKIGETIAAGKTSATIHTLTVQGEERTIAVILLGATQRDHDVQTLLRFVDQTYVR